MQGTTLANGTEKYADTNWNAIDWHQEEQHVRNLRQRIFRTTQAGDWKRVRSLQKLMWANYYRTGTAKETFNKLDDWMFYKEVRHVKRTHPNKPKKWWKRQYWGKFNLDRQDRWVFGNKQSGQHLLKYVWFPIERHVLVKGTASPDDPTLKDYWQKRNAAKVKDLTPSRQKIARKQHGICPECKNTLFNDEELHVHHRIPKAKGGKSNYGNLVLVHYFCHQQIHAREDVEDEFSE